MSHAVVVCSGGFDSWPARCDLSTGKNAVIRSVFSAANVSSADMRGLRGAFDIFLDYVLPLRALVAFQTLGFAGSASWRFVFMEGGGGGARVGSFYVFRFLFFGRFCVRGTRLYKNNSCTQISCQFKTYSRA